MSAANTPAPPAAGGSRAGMKKELPEHFKAYKHVWVVIEIERGQVHPVSWELMGEGRKLADKLGVDLAGVVMGPETPETRAAAHEAFAYGADLVYTIEDPLLTDYRNEPDLAGSVATTLQTGLTADCTELAVDADGSLGATRPTFGGSLLCTIYTLNFRPQMATIRPRVMAMPDRVEKPVGRIVSHPLGMVEDDIITKILGFIPDRDSNKNNLAYADVVVAGGLGLQSAENMRLVRQLAEVLGAEYGCSRPLVQKGWMPSDRQIGQTGKTIRPKLYIAAGISGAIQHRVGVEGADMIVSASVFRPTPATASPAEEPERGHAP